MVIEQQSLFEQSVHLLICHMCHRAEATDPGLFSQDNTRHCRSND